MSKGRVFYSRDVVFKEEPHRVQKEETKVDKDSVIVDIFHPEVNHSEEDSGIVEISHPDDSHSEGDDDSHSGEDDTVVSEPTAQVHQSARQKRLPVRYVQYRGYSILISEKKGSRCRK